MVTRDSYGKKETEICFSVLLELFTILGEFRDKLVLVGGWIPYFLIEDFREEHAGSLDIDIAIALQDKPAQTYQTILKALKKRGYKEGEQPFQFFRSITDKSGPNFVVEVDLLAGEYGGTGKNHRTQTVQDVRARKARGCDLAFDHYQIVKVSGTMPDGSLNEINLKIADAVSFLVMKGMAIWDRMKEKDAYDIYFTVLHFPGGIPELIKIFAPFKTNKLVIEGLSKIRAKFKNINSLGPVWITKFENIENPREIERIRRDVFERINTFLDALEISDYDELL
jgi:hypothetical protein